MSGNSSMDDRQIEQSLFDNKDDCIGTPLSCNRPSPTFLGSKPGSENHFTSKSQPQDGSEGSEESVPADTPQQQALVSRSVTVGTSTPKISSLANLPTAVRQELMSGDDLEELEAETSSLLQSRFRRSSPLSWRANDDAAAEVVEPPFQWQNSGGTFTSSIPIPTAIRHNDRQFSIESLLSIGSFDSIHQSSLNTTPSGRGTALDRAIDDFCQQVPGPQRPHPLNLRQSSLASLGERSSPFRESLVLKPSLLSSRVKVESPSETATTPTEDKLAFKRSPSGSEEITPQSKTTREMMLQNAARAAAGLPALQFGPGSGFPALPFGQSPSLPFGQSAGMRSLPFGHGEDFNQSSVLRPEAKAASDFWNATPQQKPMIVDRVSSANANWEMYGYNPAATGPGGATKPGLPARPTHLKNRGRSRSNVTFSDPPAIEMKESSKPSAVSNGPPMPAKTIRKQSEGAQPSFPATASSTDWSQNSTSTASTSPSAIKELPTSALEQWLSGTSSNGPKEQSPMPIAPPPSMFAPWGPQMYSASGGGYEAEMFPQYGPQGMMPPYMAHGNLGYGAPVPMMWGQPQPVDRTKLSNRGRGPGQPPKRYVSAGPYAPYPGQPGFNAFPPAFPYKRSASAPENTIDVAQKWAKMEESKAKSAPSRVKRDRSSRDVSDRKSKVVQFGHPHIEVIEGRRIYSRHTLFLLGAHRSDISAVNGNNVDGCDSLLIFSNTDSPQRKDDLAMLKFSCSSRSGGSALYASHVKNLPVRVFRKHENGKSHGFRYDGLYTVIAMFDEWGSPRSELPSMAHERVEFLLRRNPHLLPKDANAIMVESNSAFSNRLSIDEMWGHVSKTVSTAGGRELNRSSSFQGGKVLPEHCDSSISSKRPHSSLQKSKSESHQQPSSRPSRPAALNTRPRATSAEVALLHIRYFSSPEDDDDDSGGNAQDNRHDQAGSEHGPSSKRQKQSHKGGELSPEMISDAIGRLFHPDGNNSGLCAETSIQKTTVALPPDGMGRGLF